MKFSDFIVPAAIIPDLQAVTKEAAIREITTALADAGAFAPELLESITRGILHREELGSTGIGMGVALPIGRHALIERVVGTVAVSRSGVAFEALDGEPVDIIFLVVARPQDPGSRLRTLEWITRLLKDEQATARLREAETREEIVEILEMSDQGH